MLQGGQKLWLCVFAGPCFATKIPTFFAFNSSTGAILAKCGAPCTELSSMCEVDTVAPSRRPFMRLAASEIEELLFWASKSKKKRQNNFGFFAHKRLCEVVLL